jgi:pimeloyl-ACP methyl ester carboxylesterase
VLLLHGFPDSAAGWGALIDAWRGEPVRWIVPMLRGYGATRITDSEAETGEIAALADDLLLLQEALSIDRATWVGHDWGAGAVFAAAVLRPERVRAVVGLASAYVHSRDTGELPHAQERDYWYQWFFHTPQGEQSLTRDRLGLCRYLWQVWSPTWRFPEGDLLEAASAWENPQFVATVLSYYRTRHGNAPGAAPYAGAHAELEKKPKITVPTWFVVGLADACNHPEGSLGQEDWFTGGYERVELPGIGHFIHRQAPEAVAGVLARTLAETR